MKKLLTIIFFFMGIISYAQSPIDIQLADQYFKSGEYDKAAIYYEKFLNYDRNNSFYFDRYVNSLIGNGEQKKAEKALKKAIKRNPSNLVNRVHLGKLMRDSDRKSEAKKVWDKTIRNLNANQGEIIRVAREFSAIGENEYALKTYEKGKKLIKSFYSFNYEIAEVYGLMGRYDEMIDMYLELLEANPAYLQSVQNMLARNFSFEEENPQNTILRNRLLKKIQQYPDNKMYAEMLIWMFIQQKNFAGALAQTKALDKRLKEDGARVYNLARLASINKQWQVAMSAFDYVIAKGKDNFYYNAATHDKINTWKKKLDNDPKSTKEAYQELAQTCYSFIQDIGKNEETIHTIRLVAKVEAHHLNKPDTAIEILTDILKYPGIEPKSTANCKIDLGDYLVLQGNIWDAALYYMQAEKAFKYDNIGDRAKFKAAKISYYSGDFEWAKAQLDVLKGSTSKLIANDAMYLSHLITDNTGLDSIYHPMELFAKADLLREQLQYTEALTTLDSINTLYPNHVLDDDILMLRYKIHMIQKEYKKAEVSLQKIVDQYSWDILADDAIFKLAELYDYQFKDKEKAMELYQRILTDHESSLFSTEARKRFRKLRGDLVN